MRLTILFFATLKDRAGTPRHELILGESSVTIADVRRAVSQRFPTIEKLLASAVAARNEEFAFPDEPVNDGDTIAFFPPVSGGSGDDARWPEILQLADAPYSTDDLIAAITAPETGAVCTFTGVVRGVSADHTTETLEYEAYAPMALAKMQQVADEIRVQWPGVQGIAIVQRVGAIAVGHNTVLVVCASAHRDGGCFEAAKYGIDRLKAIVPVWKKEVGPNGSAWVEGDYQPTPKDIRS